MSDVEETTSPGTRIEITQHDRDKTKLLADELRGGWIKRYGAIVGFVVVTLTLLAMVLGYGDARWVPTAEAKTDKATHTAVHTKSEAGNTAAHTDIQKKHTEDINAINQALDKEISLRRLQGKDMEMNAKDNQRLDRRLQRIEDRIKP